MGGGIYSRHGTTLNSSTVSGNTKNGPGGGIFSPGSYFTFRTRYYSDGPVVLNSSTVTGNSSTGAGGGIYARGSVTANMSTVGNNTAAGAGGGIFVRTTIQIGRLSQVTSITGSASLNSSTVSENESSGAGGGLNARFVHLDTSTVSGNKALTGGGIYSHNDASITGSTITANLATVGQGGGIWNGDDEQVTFQHFDPSTFAIDSSIVAANQAASGSPDLRSGGGSLTVRQSLIGDNAGSTLAESQTFDANGNLIGSAAGGGIIDARLAPLADNGGPTKTHALLANSLALDAIPYSASAPVPAARVPAREQPGGYP